MNALAVAKPLRHHGGVIHTAPFINAHSSLVQGRVHMPSSFLALILAHGIAFLFIAAEPELPWQNASVLCMPPRLNCAGFRQSRERLRRARNLDDMGELVLNFLGNLPPASGGPQAMRGSLLSYSTATRYWFEPTTIGYVCLM